MPSPFPGMDPYLEHPYRWPSIHTQLISGLPAVIEPVLPERYTISVEERVYLTVRKHYLEIRDPTAENELIAVIEALSPTNKSPGPGREEYLSKRAAVIASRTNLVEIDLLRAGPRMPAAGAPADYDYSLLVASYERRPRALLLPFGVRDPIPGFPLALREGDEQPMIDIASVLTSIYR